MPLTNEQRKELWAQFMSDCSNIWEEIGTSMDKGDLWAVVNAIVNWIEGKESEFNSTIPQPGRTELTRKQKYRIFKISLEKIYKEIL